MASDNCLSYVERPYATREPAPSPSDERTVDNLGLQAPGVTRQPSTSYTAVSSDVGTSKPEAAPYETFGSTSRRGEARAQTQKQPRTSPFKAIFRSRAQTQDQTQKPPRTSPFRAIFQSKAQTAFLAIVAVQAVAVLGLIITVTIRYQAAVQRETDALRAILCYLIIFLLAEVFALVITLDALRAKNLLEIFGIVVFSFAMLIYASILPRQLSDAITDDECRDFACPPGGADALYANGIRGPTIGLPVVIGVTSLGLAINAYRLMSEFSWLAFKLIGADLQLVKAYRWLLAFESILKFDLFQYLVLVATDTSTAEFGITIAALPVVVVIIFLIPIVCRREAELGAYFVFFFELLGIAYALFKTIRCLQPSQAYRFETSRRSLALFSIITLVLLIITLGLSVRVYLNFGLGLKQAIPRSTLLRLAGDGKGEKDQELEQQPTRVSID